MDDEEVFDPTALIEEEGADLGSVSLAGVQRVCERCSGVTYTGVLCTRCEFAGAPSTGFLVGRGGWANVRPPEELSEAPVLRQSAVCELNGCGHSAPAPVTSLLSLAHGLGWRAVVQHSRGGVMSGAKQLADKDLWSVRFASTKGLGWQGYAVRRGDAWESVCVTGRDLPPFLKLGVTDLKEWLEQPDQPASWYADIVKRVSDQKARQKAAARERAAQRGTGSGARREHGG